MDVEVTFEDAEREGEHETYVADISKMSDELWEPAVGTRKCLERVVRGIEEKARGPEDWMFEVG
jgi:hypothetical protein